MSLLGRLKSMIVEKLVEDEFYQPISETEIYAVLNKKGTYSQNHALLNLPRTTSSQEIPDALALAQSVAHHTPELQFRLLGYEPSLEHIAAKVAVLKGKLQIIDQYILDHYADYLSSVGSSMAGFDEGRQFYTTRRKVGQARFMLEKMSKLLSRSKAITRLNITIKNLKNTVKLLEKVPNIKKMGLLQLKAIDLTRLERTNSQISTIYGGRLLCLTNLSKYILKVNQESFNYIINNIKMCFDSFDDHLYEEIMRSYLIIQPPAALDQLLNSFLEERVRTLILESNDGLAVIGNRLIGLMINLHKIIKWHIINRALKSNKPLPQTDAEPQRRLSVSSNNSQDAPTTIELGEIVYISLQGIKETFNRSVDSYLTDLVSDNILSLQLENKEIYMQLQLLARIGEICSNFTGRRLDRLRKAFLEYFNRKEAALYAKNSRQFVTSIEQQRCDWNRLPFPNNFRFAPLDRLLYRWSRMQESDDHRKINLSVNRLFLEQMGQYGGEDEDSSEEEALELKVVKMDSTERLQKRFDEWNPKGYLSLYEGDAIVSQSSYKLLGVFQRYTEFMIYAPSSRHCAYLEHMLLLVEYMTFFIFSSLLSAKYRTLFFEPTRPDTTLEKAYTLKRFRTLYPHLGAFTNSFRNNLESAQVHTQTGRFLAVFRKQVREVSAEENQALRAKIVAIDSCKYCLAYFHQILKTSEAINSEGGRMIQSRVEVMKSVLHDLSTLLLTQSCQNILSIELQAIRSLFQSIRWYQSYEDLKEYVNKIAVIVRESLQRLKGCHRGQIPLSRLHLNFVFIWRTILTYSVKLFLEGKGNNRRDNKLNFQKYVDDLYLAFDPLSFPTLPSAYSVFKSIFRILLSSDWEECRQLLLETLRKFDYIYPILLSILENSEHMATLSQKEKEMRRAELRQEIELLLRETK